MCATVSTFFRLECSVAQDQLRSNALILIIRPVERSGEHSHSVVTNEIFFKVSTVFLNSKKLGLEPRG